MATSTDPLALSTAGLSGLWIRPLTADYCRQLSPFVSREDRRDLPHKLDPEEALALALSLPGKAWVVGRENRLGSDVIGAFGWTEAGTIWSLWRPLTFAEQRTRLHLAPQVIKAMAVDAKRPLGNEVCADSKRIIAWLEATNCFTFLDNRLTWRGKTYVPFFVKPLRDIPEHAVGSAAVQ